jgi:tRNA modification GTPase
VAAAPAAGTHCYADSRSHLHTFGDSAGAGLSTVYACPVVYAATLSALRNTDTDLGAVSDAGAAPTDLGAISDADTAATDLGAVSNAGAAATDLGTVSDVSAATNVDAVANPGAAPGHHRLSCADDPGAASALSDARADDGLRSAAGAAYACLYSGPDSDDGSGVRAGAARARVPGACSGAGLSGARPCAATVPCPAAGATAAAAQSGCAAAGRRSGASQPITGTADRTRHQVTAGGFSLDDTIAVVATPPGAGGIGIVKISGPQAPAILRDLFQPAGRRVARWTPQPRRLTWGRIYDPRTGLVVDEVLAVLMPAPHSYTCQDVAEIQSHGGVVAVQHILKLVLAAGARPAAPGEMTLRAFLNGRIDLAQAEAVLDIVTARTDAALRVAVDQLAGHLSRRVRPVRAGLVNVLAYLEATIDFVEDEIPPQDVAAALIHSAAELAGLLATADRGMIYRQGVRAAIVGRPNVGKSSLLNALLRGERAIVTSIPGTTRDTLEETVNLQGVPLVLVDTAGIRLGAEDEVEQIGIERSRAALQRADLALLVVDGSRPPEDLDHTIAGLFGDKQALVAVNKCDLPGAKGDAYDRVLPNAPHLRLSALTGTGVPELEQAIVDLLLGGRVTASDVPLVSNPRHTAALRRALDHVHTALAGEQQGLSADLVAIDVRAAVDELGEITGETASEDLLEAIFSQFCLGK